MTPWTVACWAPLSMGFPRQEYWSRWSFPSPGDLPNPGMESTYPVLQADSLPSEPPEKPSNHLGACSSDADKMRPAQNISMGWIYSLDKQWRANTAASREAGGGENLGLNAKSRLREGYEDKEFILFYKMNGTPTWSTYICTLEGKKTMLWIFTT